ncbi:hypothetical protein FRC04_001671 [Tulasnella sp. 424]|nr:hypothetical protein FRC04_001671 [Tulasnella sp. 424]KAG8971116.1 hypothetical protein FRC05_011485 [Tulasnella sp. 425]
MPSTTEAGSSFPHPEEYFDLSSYGTTDTDAAWSTASLGLYSDSTTSCSTRGIGSNYADWAALGSDLGLGKPLSRGDGRLGRVTFASLASNAIPSTSLFRQISTPSLSIKDLAALIDEAQPIVSVVASAASFGNSVSQFVSRKPAEPNKKVEDNDRWLVCTVKNMTEFPILTLANWMSSGRYDNPPQRVEPFDTMTFVGCETDDSVKTGVSGGHSFCINLDGGNQFFFAFASVVEPANDQIPNLKKDDDDNDNEGKEAQLKLAQKAYDNVNKSGNMIKSPIYKTKDADGKEVVFQFQISASAGQEPLYTITEVRDYFTVVCTGSQGS